MKIKRLNIENYKSIVQLEIIEPAPFAVFIGPNGAGKSNIFEALEFAALAQQMSFGQIDQLFGGVNSYLNHNFKPSETNFNIELDSRDANGRENGFDFAPPFIEFEGEETMMVIEPAEFRKKENLSKNFSRIFIGHADKVKLNTDSGIRLKIDGSNLEKVLKRLLREESIREEILEWLGLFIPEFKDVSVHADEVSGTDTLLLYMKGYEKPFGKHLISDGTYNILCLLTAVYQSDVPQFLCIEEPENGLNPYVIRQMVQFFRDQCTEKGHLIWLNTHSQTLVSQLKAEEVILVDKKDGATTVKQFRQEDLHGLSMDEAWLTNALGGGLPW